MIQPTHSKSSKRLMILSVLMEGILFVALMAFGGSTTSTTCAAPNACPEPASYGHQPYPVELIEVFERAGTNRLGDNAPELPQIWKGYPPAQAKQISPYVPCILLKAIGYTESTGWKQFNASYGQSGDTVVSVSCGYGIMQVTSGMDGTEPSFVPSRVASEPAYNIGTGAYILIQSNYSAMSAS